MKRRPQAEPGPSGPMDKAMELARKRPSPTDPLGSWTGVPADPAETPVLDADDI